jgi:hypothetical protein
LPTKPGTEGKLTTGEKKDSLENLLIRIFTEEVKEGKEKDPMITWIPDDHVVT